MNEEKPNWIPEWHPVEQEYIKQTGKLPYQEGDKDLSKEFKEWLRRREERLDMENAIKQVLEQEKKEKEI